MAISITIRNVPEEVRDALASRAALAGQSLQEHLLAQLVEIARRPSVHALLERVRTRKATTGSRMSASQILEHKDKDRERA